MNASEQAIAICQSIASFSERYEIGPKFVTDVRSLFYKSLSVCKDVDALQQLGASFAQEQVFPVLIEGLDPAKAKSLLRRLDRYLPQLAKMSSRDVARNLLELATDARPPIVDPRVRAKFITERAGELARSADVDAARAVWAGFDAEDRSEIVARLTANQVKTFLRKFDAAARSLDPKSGLDHLIALLECRQDPAPPVATTPSKIRPKTPSTKRKGAEPERLEGASMLAEWDGKDPVD